MFGVCPHRCLLSVKFVWEFFVNVKGVWWCRFIWISVMVCQIEFPVSWQTLTGAKLDFLLCQTLSHVTCIYPCLLSMWKIYCSMILPVTAKSEDYKICKQPYITSILPTSVFVREIGISYLLPQLMKYSNNYNNILISHHQMHADHSRSSTYNWSIYYNLFLVVYCHSCLFCEKKNNI